MGTSLLHESRLPPMVAEQGEAGMRLEEIRARRGSEKWPFREDISGERDDLELLGQFIEDIDYLLKIAEAAERGTYGEEVGVEGEERQWFVLEGWDAIQLRAALSPNPDKEE